MHGNALSRHDAEATWLALGAFSQPLEFVRCGDLADEFLSITRGWQSRKLKLGEAGPPFASIQQMQDGFRWVSQTHPAPRGWNDTPPKDRFDALCNIQLHLIECFLIDNPTTLCLHCAAVEFGDGLVAFPGPSKAGKSTLAVQLAATGMRVFCDDTLLVNPTTGLGIAPGFLPRVRLPLPAGSETNLAPFVSARGHPQNERFSYVQLDGDEVAPFGTAAPVVGLVLLDRQEKADARFSAVKVGEMLKQTIRRNLAEDAPPADIFDRLLGIVSKAQRYRLEFASGEDAVAALAGKFGGGVRRC